jgi:hypothetical protein
MTTPAVTEISRNGNPIGERVDEGFRARRLLRRDEYSCAATPAARFSPPSPRNASPRADRRGPA